jgi:cell division control protein 24
MNEIKSQQILNKTQVEELFANLPELLDFQRRFILALESTLAQAPEEQRIGQLFLQHEQAFYVYEPFCGNYKTATKIALQEKDKLAALTHLIEPTYGLQSYLIKPVQRVCKYPLLLKV